MIRAQAEFEALKAALGQEPQEHSTLHVGLLGDGRIGGVHATAITSNRRSTLVTAVKAAPDKGKIGKAELSSITSFDPAMPLTSRSRVGFSGT